MKHLSHIIIGGGPAGIQMAYFMQKANLNYVVLEKEKRVGSFFEKYPLNRTLISVNKPNCGVINDQNHANENKLRYDWNSLLTENGVSSFSTYTSNYYPSADTLVEYLNDFTREEKLNVMYNCFVMVVRKNEDIFQVQYIKDGNIHEVSANNLFISTGLQPRKSPLRTQHDRVFTYDTLPKDLNIFKNKKLLILGGGNAAFETANMLNEIVDEMTLCGGEKFAWNTHYPGFIRSINMKIIDSYYLKLKFNLDWANLKSLRQDDKLKSYIRRIEKGNIWKMVDYVVICLGFSPYFDFIDDCTINIHKNMYGFPKLTPFFESTSTPHIYFLGALSQDEDYKHGTSAFIHGFRYNTRLVFQYITNTFVVKSFYCFDSFLHHLIKEINVSSQLLHRFDFHGHIVFLDEIPKVTHHIPLSCLTNKQWVAYLLEVQIRSLFRVPILTIHLGYDKRNTFMTTFRQPQTGHPRSTEKSVFLHPIIRLYECKEDSQALNLVNEFHLPEEAFNSFNHPVYHETLLRHYLQVLRMKMSAPPYHQAKAIESLTNLIKTFYAHQ